MKYKVELGSFVTKLVTRKIIVHAKSEAEAAGKAINKFIEIEMKDGTVNDAGEPHIDFINKIES